MKGATLGVVTGKVPKSLPQKHSDLSIFKLSLGDDGVGGGWGGVNLNIGEGGVAGETEVTEALETSFSAFVSIKASFPSFNCSSRISVLSSFRFFILISLTSQSRRRFALVAFLMVSANRQFNLNIVTFTYLMGQVAS